MHTTGENPNAPHDILFGKADIAADADDKDEDKKDHDKDENHTSS